jgi:hypothetical protein
MVMPCSRHVDVADMYDSAVEPPCFVVAKLGDVVELPW